MAEAETKRARAAERKVTDQLEVVSRAERARVEEERARQSAEKARESAVNAATRALTEVELSRERLAQTNIQLQAALAKLRAALALANREAARSADLAKAERAAKEKASALLARERERVRQLEEQKRDISTSLK